MIDSKLVLINKEFLKSSLEKKGFDIEVIDALETVMLEIRSQKANANELCRKRNESSRDCSISSEDKRKLRKKITNTDKDLKALERYAQKLLYDIPNLPDPDAPIGLDESCNNVIFKSDDHVICTASKPAPHWEIAERLNIIDFQKSSKISGSGFVFYKGKGAKLHRALVNYGLSLHENRYAEITPPHLVTTEAMTHTGHLPKFASDQYRCMRDDLWLIPTAEVPMTAAFAKTLYPQDSLPEKYMGYTLAFRRESGAPGIHTRGLQRVHEFHKVELLKIVEPSMVDSELAELLEDCLKIIKDLKLQYRVVDLCTGDMGDKYARCYDIEVYSPGVMKWLEVSSVGHFSDYQARRANIKYVDSSGKKKFAYTMNGSAIATARVWLSIIETYQQSDGSVKIPEALVPFVGCDVISAGL